MCWKRFTIDDGNIEKVMGMLFILMSEKNKELNYYNKTEKIIDEQKIITTYDIYMTIINRININESKIYLIKESDLMLN